MPIVSATINKPAIVVESPDWSEYALLDSGARLKLERFGNRVLVRSEPKAWWPPALPVARWREADAAFEDEGKEARWRFYSKDPSPWEVVLDGTIRLQARFTESSKHVGFFPEQQPHWAWIKSQGARLHRNGGKRRRLLNLFGYTGVASLVAAKAGFEVTHVDASKPAVTWGRDNQARSGMTDAPIRWIIEDVVKYVKREIRRGARYDALLLDPPSFGRGPNREMWKADAQLMPLLEDCRVLLGDQPELVLMTLYSLDISALCAGNLLRVMLGAEAAQGDLATGELVVKPESGQSLLPLSLYARWSRQPSD